MNAPISTEQPRSGTKTTSAASAGQSRPAETSVRALEQDDWRLFRSLVENIAKDSPGTMAGPHPKEWAEREWRSRVHSARRLVAEQNGAAVGVVSVRSRPEEPSSSEVTGLWVAPAARNGGIGTQLVETAAAMEARDGKRQLYYWVGIENASAIAFASNTGFRVTSHRRSAPTDSHQPDRPEVAFVMSLATDPAAVPNGTDAG